MGEENKNILITFDKMKDQVDKEINNFIKANKNAEILEFPKVTFEKGICCVAYKLPDLNEYLLYRVIELMKKHIENIRIHSLECGYYAFQALNSNLFKTDDILDNLKVQLYGITTNYKIEISKRGNFTQEEINLAIEIFRFFYSKSDIDPAQELRKLGASVYYDNNSLNWNYIAGYEDVKRKIRESIIMPLQNPEMYDSVAKLTRRVFESNRPKAILFEGSPGVGKTTIARLIAGEVKVPLVYLPIESIMSKWFGQSSQNLSSIFDYCEAMGNTVLFLDEIDSLAGSRDKNMFEATRRVLSVLLRRLDGIDAVNSTITIGATNRKNDLDGALLSRFDQTIFFPLPNDKERAAIFGNYAKHLNDEDLMELAKISEKLSGRNIKDVCEYTERRWTRKLIIKKEQITPPTIDYYKYSVNSWIGDRELDLEKI